MEGMAMSDGARSSGITLFDRLRCCSLSPAFLGDEFLESSNFGVAAEEGKYGIRRSP
jgi:hypothetical protein